MQLPQPCRRRLVPPAAPPPDVARRPQKRLRSSGETTFCLAFCRAGGVVGQAWLLPTTAEIGRGNRQLPTKSHHYAISIAVITLAPHGGGAEPTDCHQRAQWEVSCIDFLLEQIPADVDFGSTSPYNQ
jgi:hypothetical protein